MEAARVDLYLASGETVRATVWESDVPGGDLEDVEGYVRTAVRTPPAPHWATIGDVDVFTQSLAGWTVV
jgi:hypothetical protein